MKIEQSSGTNRPSPHWLRFAAAGLLAAAIAGCGGGGTGANTAVQTTTMTAAQWVEADPVVEVSSVAINSAPVVSFKVKDKFGKPIAGLTTTQLRFTIAKLVDGQNGVSSKWVNYIVGNPATGVPSRPNTENVAANLVDNKDGSYSYKFAFDITGPAQAKIAEWFGNAATKDVTTTSSTGVKTTLTYAKADVLGADGKLLDYNANLPHRVVIQLSGALNGGTLANPVNAVYDFVPATGKLATADLKREVVSIESCNSCHEKLAFHGGGRVETKYCAVCHTDQRKNGYTSVESLAGKFPELVETATPNATTGITTYSYKRADGKDFSYVYDGEVVGDFTTMIHKIHQGKDLTKQNYYYAGIVFNNKAFSMLGGGQKMCSTCHSGTAAVNANNWSTKPSRQACASCHDGINFDTGSGHAIVKNDAGCVGCHTSEDIKVYHRTDNVTKHNPTIATGLVTFTYEIKSASVDPATNDLSVVFKINADGKPVTFVAPAATVAAPLSGFTGSPSFMLAYAMPQDGIAKPVDYNNAGVGQAQAITVSIADLLSTSKAGTVGSLSAVADTNGYYTATIKGDGTKKFPVGATMRAVALQGYFTQAAGTNGIAVANARHAISVMKPVTGDAVRRTVVDSAKCSNCHEWFEGHGGNRVYDVQVCVMCHTPGLATSGRGVPDSWMSTKVFDAASVKVLAEWGVDPKAANAALKLPVTTNNFKDMIHGIHAGRDRVTPFMDARDSTSRGSLTLLDFRRMDFPGVLSKCSACHTSSTTATTTYNTVPSNVLLSTYESIDAAYNEAIGAGTATPALAKAALGKVSETDIVTTPFAAACVSCHDNKTAKAHVEQTGGMVNVTRAAAKATVESCATCHGPGRTYDAAVVHK